MLIKLPLLTIKQTIRVSRIIGQTAQVVIDCFRCLSHQMIMLGQERRPDVGGNQKGMA